MGSVRHKEDKHDPCSRMTREVVKCSMFLIKFCLIKKKRVGVMGCVPLDLGTNDPDEELG